MMEAVLTFFLLTVIPATAPNQRLVGHNAALAVSGTIALCGRFAAPVEENEDQRGRTPAVEGYAACSTAPMANPARVPIVTTARNSSQLRTGPLSE